MIKGTMLHVVIMVKGILLILGEMSDLNFLRTCSLLRSLKFDFKRCPDSSILRIT
jgi:hypothetical protein